MGRIRSGGDLMPRILVVDDEKDLLVLIKNILEKRNYTVDTYLNPTEIEETK